MTKKQWKHASRVYRTNNWDYTLKFFRNYPEELIALKTVYSLYWKAYEKCKI